MTTKANYRDRHCLAISAANDVAAEKYQQSVDLYMSGNAGGEAQDLQRSRLDPQPTVRDRFRPGRAQIGCDRPEEAATSLRTAAERWRDADPSSPEVATINQLLEGLAAVH